MRREYKPFRFRNRPLLLLLASVLLGAGCAGTVAEQATYPPRSPKAYVGNFKDNTLSVIDTTAKRVLSTIPIPPGPHGLVITPNGRWVYVSSDGASTVSVIDTATDKVVENIEVGKNPHGLAVTPDGSLVLVAVYDTNSVAFVDSVTRRVVGSVAIGRPHNIAMHPNGRVAYVGSQTPGKFSLAVVDIPGRAVTTSIALEKTPRGLEVTPDGRYLYLTQAGVDAVVALDTVTNKITAQIAVGVSPHYAIFTPNGRQGLTVVQGPSVLTVFNPETNVVQKNIPVGKRPHWVAVSSDGATAFTTNEESNDVSIVDLTTGAITTVAVGNAPRKIAVQPGPGKRATSAPSVEIAGFAFEPATLKVALNAAVTWFNRDGAPHSVQFQNGPASDTLMPGRSYALEFSLPGTYEYVCSLHPYMTGSIVVAADS